MPIPNPNFNPVLVCFQLFQLHLKLKKKTFCIDQSLKVRYIDCTGRNAAVGRSYLFLCVKMIKCVYFYMQSYKLNCIS